MNPVRVLQHHLRQAGTHIAARRFDEASAHVDAALAIDPASLAALTLRDRLRAGRTAAGAASSGRSPVPPPPASRVDDGPADAQEPPRFIPSGVNAASWLDFEQRIQDRRFHALIETAQRAIAIGDGVAARIAIEEAREHRPDAIEVAQLSARAASLPIAGAEHVVRSRAMRAVTMLLVGVTLLLGLDWMRSGTPDESRPIVTADASAAIPAVGTSAAPEALTTPITAPAPEIPTASEALAPAPTGGASDEAGLPRDVEANPRAPIEDARPIAAASTAPRQTLTAPVAPRGETPDDYVVRRSEREVAAVVAAAPVLPPSGEIPDSYVFTPPRRETAPVREPAVLRPSNPAPAIAAANVVRQPGSVVESLGTPRGGASSSAPVAAPAPPPAATAVVSARANDENAVHSTLRQYARAYGELDARAARAVWPSVNERALAKAFGDLASQEYVFDACDVSIGTGGQTATASCRGHASYVTKIGNQGPRNEARTWSFDLRRDGDAWKIARAETRR